MASWNFDKAMINESMSLPSTADPCAHANGATAWKFHYLKVRFPVKSVTHVIERVTLWQHRFPLGAPVSSYIHYKLPNIVYRANILYIIIMS
jgi:hypothetical protein